MTAQINDEHRSGIAGATLIGRFGSLDEVTPVMIFRATDVSSTLSSLHTSLRASLGHAAVTSVAGNITSRNLKRRYLSRQARRQV
jgi:hypothetical protein